MDPSACTAAFERLVRLAALLRSEEGCAWDRAQTIDTLRPHLVEELHEVLEALDQGDDARLRDELGDLLFLVVFMASIAEDDARFSLEAIIESIDAKLRRRHPHVFGDAIATTPDEVRSRWETVKLGEETHRARASILDGLPRDLPSLLTARRMQEKAAAVGFDWQDIGDVVRKVDEEIGELRREIADGARAKYEEELGDILFAVVNVARFLGVDPEAALRKTNAKFRTRFAEIEERFEGRDLRQVGLAAMDQVWNEIKRKETGR